MSTITWQVALARLRFPLLIAAVALVVLDPVALPGPVQLALFVAAYLVVVRAGTVRRDPITVRPPVAGAWTAVNSPETRVPSHGIQVYGQTYAIDLAHEPGDPPRPGLGWWPLLRRPSDFPGYGRPVHAAADGVVRRTHGRERDHWSRTSLPGMAYLLVESVLRELTGPARVLGNHVVVEHDDGTFAAYAHLRRRSLTVTRGQRVHAGQHLGDCGNSGNSTEPHLHFQLMDHRNVLVAAGLPVSFSSFTDGGAVRRGMPANGSTVELAPAEPHPATT